MTAALQTWHKTEAWSKLFLEASGLEVVSVNLS
jgi:hypothetical protein